MKKTFLESDKEQEQLRRRMDRFDSIVCEYCRHYRKSVEQLAQRVGCSTASLWRYRTQVDSFCKAPLDVIAGCLRVANVSNVDLRYILGLPTGQRNGEET